MKCFNTNCQSHSTIYRNNCRHLKNSINLNVCKLKQIENEDGSIEFNPKYISIQGFLNNKNKIDPNIKPDKKVVIRRESQVYRDSRNAIPTEIKFEITLKALNKVSQQNLMYEYHKTGTTLQKYIQEVFKQCHLKKISISEARKNELYLKTVQEEYDKLFNDKMAA